jgi:hypothetical protein
MIDPLNWGNLNFSSDSLNVEAQAAVLDSFKEQKTTKRKEEGILHRKEKPRSLSKENARRASRTTKPVKKSKRHHQPAESQPAAQIAPKSYFGAALRSVGRSRGSNRPSTSPSSSSQPSSESSNDSSSLNSSDESFTVSEQSQQTRKRRRDNRHGRNRRRLHRSQGPFSNPFLPRSIMEPPMYGHTIVL